jgi:LacI family transcriptional regulator/LacI family repressor for deo operon, udp, cdd, tsx, nupC, and nupG
MKKITINDVAKTAGVSKGTVSAVINSRSTVNAKTREHILRVMRNLNYQPLGQARNLRGQQIGKSIGLIMRELDNPFYAAVAVEIKKYANSKDYILFIASSESDHQNEENIAQLFAANNVKGVIIAPVINGTVEIEHLFHLKMLNYPFVMLEEVQGILANVVSINNVKATSDAVKYLIEIGHTNILNFSGPKFASHTAERIKGFRKAFSESHLAFNDDLVVCCGSHFHDGFNTGIKYFENIDRKLFPMAVVCYNDVVALGLMSALHKLNIKVPEEVSIIGNDDIEFAQHWSPALTTISTPFEELGKKAAEILINNIEAERALPIENIILNSKIVIRETTRKIK